MADNSFRSYTYPLREVLPSIDELARYLHAADTGHPVYESMQRRLAELHAAELTAVGGYRLLPAATDLQRGEVTVGGTVLATGVQVCGYMKEADRAALFVCTAGEVFTEMTRALNAEGDFLEAYVVDAIGSLTVERAMDNIQSELEREMAAQGLRITNRYSPGYCNWPLVGQQALFGAIGEHGTGVTLSSTSLMSPIKSVSGIIGIGAEVRRREYGCAVCSNSTCIYRKIVAREREC